MATKDARVRLSGRFRAGEKVRLYAASGADQARPEGAPLALRKMGADRTIEFTAADGVEAGGYYLLVGFVDGQPVQVRARGKVDGDNETLSQAPVAAEPQTFRTEGHVPGPHPRVEEQPVELEEEPKRKRGRRLG